MHIFKKIKSTYFLKPRYTCMKNSSELVNSQPQLRKFCNCCASHKSMVLISTQKP